MELRHLRYFVALGEELHFGRAAERLEISQPPLSQQIARLERNLGVPLFRRTSRSVELTPAGRLFLDEARRTLAQADYAAQVARRAQGGDVGRLRIGFVPVCGLMPKAVRRFMRRHPGVQLTLTCMRTADQVACVAQGVLDAGFVHLPIDAPSLAVDEVQRHALVAALPSGHRLAARPSVPWSALAGEPFVGFPRESAPAAYDALISRLREAGAMPNVVHQTDSMLARLRLVAAGLGVSLLPSYVARFPRTGIVLRPLRGPKLSAAIGMVYDPRRMLPPLERFRRVVRDAVGSRE